MPKLIAHRGNIGGADSTNENAPLYVEAALGAGFDCEVDLWCADHKFFLGHDRPQYKVEYSWLHERKHVLWIHCKNVYALEFCQNAGWHYFWHETDQFTLTSNRVPWAYPTATLVHDGIIACPEMHYTKSQVLSLLKEGKIGGICSDHVGYYKNMLGSDFKVI